MLLLVGPEDQEAKEWHLKLLESGFFLAHLQLQGPFAEPSGQGIQLKKHAIWRKSEPQARSRSLKWILSSLLFPFLPRSDEKGFKEDRYLHSGDLQDALFEPT